MKNNCMAVCTLLLLTSRLFGQGNQYDLVLPRLDVEVGCTVRYDGSDGIFRYAYSITNLKISSGYVAGFDIDIAYPLNAVDLPLTRLTDSKHVWRGPLGFPNAHRVIPVGVPELPNSGEYSSTWWAAFGVSGSIEWTSPYGRFDVAPGGKLSDIVITSHGVPTLRTFVVSPRYHPKPPVEITPENEQTIGESSEAEDSAEILLEDSIKVRGWTVGPTAPPAEFSASSWIDTLVSYKHRCVKLGWVDNQGVANSLDSKLNTARKKLEDGDSATAKNILNAFVNEVEAQNGKHLTNEAYALLKYNAEYLIDRLRETFGKRKQ